MDDEHGHDEQPDINLDRKVIGFWPQEMGQSIQPILTQQYPELELPAVSPGDARALLLHFPVVLAADESGKEEPVALDFFETSGRGIVQIVHYMKTTAENILDHSEQGQNSAYALSLHEIANAMLTSMITQNIGYVPDNVTIIVDDD